MILGKNLIVSIDGTPAAGAKSCQLSISNNFISVCSPTASRVVNKKPTNYEWSMSVDCLIPSSNLSVTLTRTLIAGTRVLLTFTDSSGNKRAGFAYVKDCKQSGSVGSLATFSASFEADGELYEVFFAPSLSKFTEGNDKLISINERGEITINNVQSGDDIGITNFSIGGSGYKMIVYINEVIWILSNDTMANVKSCIANNDGQGLEDNTVAYSQGTNLQIIDLPGTGGYVLAANMDDTFGALIVRTV